MTDNTTLECHETQEDRLPHDETTHGRLAEDQEGTQNQSSTATGPLELQEALCVLEVASRWETSWAPAATEPWPAILCR
eukprot:5483725-Pyramimonas_sp.AAC.1